MADIAKAYVQIIPSADGIQDKLESELSGASDKAGASSSSKFSSSFTKGISTVGKVGAAALAATTTAVTAFGASAVSAGADFDTAMSQVAATMGENANAMVEYNGETVAATDALRDFAQQMGSSTAFSATEAAEALNYMALAGYDVEKSIDMLPNVLSLASAGAIDLADASEMVTGVSNALGLETEETAAMVDQMAVAASKSGTSVSELGQAMSTIGATAASLSGGTAELSTMLGVLADNNIKGAEGGTHLRNILLSLQDAAVDGKVAMGDFSVSIYDNEGNMRSMLDIVNDMQYGLEDLDQASRDAVISGVFNKTDLASVNALLNTESDHFWELKAAITDSAGAAQTMADVQLDNLSGDITLFQSALEGAKIAVSDSLTPTLREFVEFGTSGLSELTEAFKTDGIEGAVDTLGDLLGQGLSMIVSKLPSFVEAGASLLSSLISGLLENADMIASSAVEIVSALATTILSLVPVIFDAWWQILASLITGIADFLPDLIDSAITMVEELGNALIDNVDPLLDAAVELLDAIITGITENIGKLMEVSAKITTKLVNTLVEKAPELMESGIQLLLKLIDGIIQNLPQLIPCGLQIINSVNTAIISNLPTILEAGITLIGELLAGIIQAIPELIEQIPEICANMQSSFGSFDWISVGKSIVSGIVNGIKNAASSLTSAAKEVAKSAYDSAKSYLKINSPSKLFRDDIGSAIPEGMAVGIEDNTDYVTDAMKGLADDSIKSFDVNSVINGTTGTYTAGNFSTGLEGAMFTLVDQINLGDTKLKEIISQYTIQKVGNETRALKVAQGGYY